jgi:hypothetical protein
MFESFSNNFEQVGMKQLGKMWNQLKEVGISWKRVKTSWNKFDSLGTLSNKLKMVQLGKISNHLKQL